MRPKDKSRAASLLQKIGTYESAAGALPGIQVNVARAALVDQMLDSLRRIDFAHFIRDARIDPRRGDPTTDIFDPLRAAVLAARKGEMDEAFWLVFLGKHEKNGWRLVAAVYRGGASGFWTWARVSSNLPEFKKWLAANQNRLRSKYRFSNHRKYQSFAADTKAGTGNVIASYVKWVSPPRTHQALIREIHQKVGQNPKDVFHHLYMSLKAVMGFGRLGKFDFLTMLGKLGIAPIEPDSAYLVEATGPAEGARLLFGGSKTAKITPRALDQRLAELDSYLRVGMQVLEDSLCNWQKSPNKYCPFRG